MDILLVVIVFLIPTLSFLCLKINYKKYRTFNSKINVNGSVISKHLFVNYGLEYLGLEKIQGELKDNYNASKKIIYLSDNTYNGTNLASISIAAFEFSHALQDAKDNIILKLKTVFYPIIKLATTFSYWVLIFGFVLHWDEIFYVGVGITMIGLLINLIFLSVEFDALKKSITLLKENKLIASEEEVFCKKFLKSYCFKNISEMMTNSLRFIDLIFVKEESSNKNVDNK